MRPSLSRNPTGDRPRVPMGPPPSPSTLTGGRPFVATRKVDGRPHPYGSTRSSIGFSTFPSGPVRLSTWGFSPRVDYCPGWVGVAERVGDAGKISFSSLALLSLGGFALLSVLTVGLLIVPEAFFVLGPIAAVVGLVALGALTVAAASGGMSAISNFAAWVSR